MNFNQLINEIRKLNPGVEIRIGDERFDREARSRIFSSVPMHQLKLPEGYYSNEKNGITNKHNAENGLYTQLRVESLDDMVVDLTYPNVDVSKNLESTDVREIAIALQKLNPGVTIKLINPSYENVLDKQIYCNVPAKELALPQPFYYDEKNGITNKHTSKTGLYITINVEDISKVNPELLVSTGYDLEKEKTRQYENLVRMDAYNLSKVPLEFQTFKIQRIAFDECESKQIFECIPKAALSEEIILYAIEKGFVDDLIFYDIPNEFKTYEVCKNAVIHCPSIIKLVPLKFITKDFLKEIEYSSDYQVWFSKNYIEYIKECLQANDKINGVISLNTKTTIEASKSPKNKLLDNIKNIDINTLNFLTPSMLNLFKAFGINNLRELFNAQKTPEFYVHCDEYYSRFSKEERNREKILINNTIRLLRCKYLDEAPLIDINDDQIKFSELCLLLGFHKRNIYSLLRSGIIYDDSSAKEYFQKMQDQSSIKSLDKVRALGKITFFDILWRTDVIIDYYKRHSNEKVQDEDNEIEYLKNELQRLREESKRIDIQIDIIIEKIQEKTLNQSKGGAIK